MSRVSEVGNVEWKEEVTLDTLKLSKVEKQVNRQRWVRC